MPYRIQAGDTLAGIAKANGTTVQELMRLNPGIKDGNSIFAGEEIVLPGESAKSLIEESLRTALKLNPMTATTYYALNREELREDVNKLKEAHEKMKPVKMVLESITNPVMGLINTMKLIFSRD